MTLLLHFLSEILPCGVLTYISVRGKHTLFASVALYILCTTLVNFTLQFQQVKAQLPEVRFQMSTLGWGALKREQLTWPQDLAELQWPLVPAPSPCRSAKRVPPLW